MYLTKDQLFLAYKKAKRWKSTQNIWIKKWIENEEENLDILYKELVNKKYTISKPKRYIIQDPVLREIIYVPFRDRIIQHLIHDALYPLVEHQSIHDVYSNMVWRWNLYAIKRISRFMRSCSVNFTKDCRIMKLDIQAFFLSINKEILWNKVYNLILRKFLTSKRYDWDGLLAIIKETIFKDYRDYDDYSNPTLHKIFPYHKSMNSTDWTYWLPLWNLTSQLFANIYLHEFDVFVKKGLWIKYYGRYVDDFILIHEDKQYLISCHEKIREFLEEKLKLTLHPKKFYLQHVSKWIKFLWIMIYPYYRTLGKRTIYRANKKMKNLNQQTQPRQSWKSYDWLALHHNNRKLRQKWERQYKDFELSKLPNSKNWHQTPLF